MLQRNPIDPYDLLAPTFGIWDKTWFLLTAGTFPVPSANTPSAAGGAAIPPSPPAFNSMTVSWGGLGFIWGKPLAIVVVRPQRFTFEFMERSADFSLCAFPESQRAALNLLGVKSGRDSAKMAASGLTPQPLPHIASPGFAEAELVLSCRKSYWQDLDPTHFLAPYIARQYRHDYHRMYFGEVLAIEGTPAWRRQ